LGNQFTRKRVFWEGLNNGYFSRFVNGYFGKKRKAGILVVLQTGILGTQFTRKRVFWEGLKNGYSSRFVNGYFGKPEYLKTGILGTVINGYFSRFTNGYFGKTVYPKTGILGRTK